MIRRLAGFLFALCLALPAQAAAPIRSTLEQARIDYLIASVASLHDAVFIRNGSEYDATKAAAHLRDKLDYAGAKVATASQFIDKCATASWFSNRKYTIRFHDGHMVESAVYLRGKLKEYDDAYLVHLR